MIKLEILFEDAHILAVNKMPGIPVQDDKSKDTSLLAHLSLKYPTPLHLINRLDRPASGIVLIAKTQESAARLSQLIQQKQMQKSYLAAVSRPPDQPEGKLQHFLVKRKRKAYLADKGEMGKKAVLSYRTLTKTEHYHLLEIDLQSGRFHQIRVQLSLIGCPIKGDVKYGARRANKDRSIHLHAWKLSFQHPFSGKEVKMRASLPDDPLWNAVTGLVE